MSELSDPRLTITETTIDVEKVIASKNPKLLKWIPKFLIHKVKRIIHQDEINEIIYSFRNDQPVEFATHILKRFGVEVSSTGMENLAKENRFLVASNHPLGGLDGMALLSQVGQKFPDVVFPVNDLLLFIPQFHGAFIPVNKHGSNASNAAIFNENFASAKPILYFPAGLCSRKQKGGIIRDLEWKKTFISLAVKNQRDIVPTHVEGANSNFFYNLANWRKRLKIKANIEMIYLPDEMFRQKGAHLKIVFAQPVSYQFFDKSRKPIEWARLMRDFCYTIKNGTESFQEYVAKQQK
ncbi:MAG: 1-acyl-sn-glycerol-3-phosphate acyltransferase [Bacteroidales bacterium]|nr:1-acyl-sn-glycerol-3-phosphate acyltransferase [Bacteroidales bacterium]